MRVSQIFWRWKGAPVPLDKNTTMERLVDSRIWFAADESQSILANYMLVEEPSFIGAPVACIDSIVNPDSGIRKTRPILYTFSSEPFPKTVYDPAPRCLEILLEITRDYYKAIAADPEKSGRAVECFMQFEEYAEHLSPGAFHLQHFTIALRWSAWERKKLSWAARAADLLEGGISFNPDGMKNIDSLKKHCQRTLNLNLGTF